MQKRWLICVMACLFIGILSSFAGAEDNSATRILNISIAGYGKVTGKNITCSTACRITLPEGTTVELAAVPATEWHFAGWGGACEGKEGCTVQMDKNKAVEAIFTYP
ncbi:MAG: hypothetical protein P8013_00655 [Candidatus Sulfobium sp.]